MENIGTVLSISEAHRAIKFLARLGCVPMSFFGITHGAFSSQPDMPIVLWLTYNTVRHEALTKVPGSKFPIGMSISELAGALMAWQCMKRTHVRAPKRPRKVAPTTTEHIEPTWGGRSSLLGG
jgi:hypothetical protein